MSKIQKQRIHSSIIQICNRMLTIAPSSWNMADAPTRSDGAIFLLQRLRRNVSDERSFL